MNRHALRSLLLVAALPAALCAQDYRWEQADGLGIKYRVFQKLQQLPMKLGESHPNLRARFEPGGQGDYIWGSKGRYTWYLNVYEFKRPDKDKEKAKEDASAKTPPKSPEEAEAMARQIAADKRTASSFREFVTDVSKDPGNNDRKFNPKAKGAAMKKNQAMGTKLPYTWWEFTDVTKLTDRSSGESFDQIWYSCAAVYDLVDGEVALIVTMPVKRGDKPESKHLQWAKKMVLSASLLKEGAADEDAEVGDEDLFAHAQTPERKKAVEAAVANIHGLENWDIFTTESYIVLYSWPAGKDDKKKKYFLESKDIAENMDRMRELYKQYYPPKEGTVFPYSVMRICSTAEEFHKYGGSGGGVIGWFSPLSKELVLFIDNDKEQTKTVAFHEGWHQYSDTYFPGVELQRWFDEGTGDYFGSYEWQGGRWRYDVSKMRKVSIKTIVSSKKHVPLSEIVTWNKDKFYGPLASDYYAQGYAMVDFLERGGEKRAAGWDPAWNGILETYRATMLETKKPKEAVDKAFAGVDWDRFTEAWIRWVKSY